HLGLRHQRHDRERGVRALLADGDIRLVLIEDALGRLGRRQRAAGGILILHLELEAVDAGRIERLERKLDALLVLCAEIGTGAGIGKSAPILIVFSAAKLTGAAAPQRTAASARDANAGPNGFVLMECSSLPAAGGGPMDRPSIHSLKKTRPWQLSALPGWENEPPAGPAPSIRFRR